MSLVPAFEIGVWNAWWFMIVYLLQWLAVALIGGKLLQRTGNPPDTEQNQTARRITLAGTITWVVATLYSIFLPFHTGTTWFYVGLAFFTVGFGVLILGTVGFARSPADQPVTGYIFRYTRHPGYLSMFLVYIGVSFATISWLFFLITIVTVFLQRRTAIFEENYCLKRYGETYRAYMERTPRWIGIPK